MNNDIGMNYDDLLLKEQTKGSMDGGKLGETDSDKWEMDVDRTLDRLYHSWLGEKINSDGVWERDQKLKKLMNSEGASYLISEVQACFNMNMQFSVLEIDEIRWMVASTIENINKTLTADYELYEIEPRYIKSIINQIWRSIYTWYKIPFMGGMREYKGNKGRLIINKQEVSSQAY